MSENIEGSAVDMSEITINDFYAKLRERVSTYNAKLLLQSVIVGSGISEEEGTLLNREDAKTICLELIKKGGPAFQVGKAMYNQVQ